MYCWHLAVLIHTAYKHTLCPCDMLVVFREYAINCVHTGCASHSGLNTKSPCWRTKLYIGVHRDTWVLWLRSPIYQAVGHCALPGTSRLSVPSVRLSTVGTRPFPVAGPRIWNSLPQETTSAQSLSLFRQRLKLHLFKRSYPDLDIWCFVLSDCFCYSLTLK